MPAFKLAPGFAIVALLVPLSSMVWAQDSADPPPNDDSMGLDLEVTFASAYVFRGLNVLQEDGQNDQHAFVAPAVTWAVGDTGVSLGYWGAYQLNGENRSDNTDAALNAEQDLIASYEIELAEGLTLSPSLVYYLYPFADEEAAGTSMPSMLEPIVGLSYASVVDLGLNLSYFYAVQEEIKGLRHIYVNPTVGKSFELSNTTGLELGAGVGYKRFDEAEVKDNVYDVMVNVAAPLDAGGGASITPSVNAAWTNLQDQDFADEYVVWGGLALGYGL